jgi:hypothetical protein
MIKDTTDNTTVTIEMLREVLQSEKQLIIKPTGKSMGRLFAMADAVIIEPMPANALSVGDIIAFPRHTGWVAHRVISRSGKRPDWHYRTCGDSASRLDDDIITHTTAIGVIYKIKMGKRIINLRSPWHRFAAYLHAKRNILITSALSGSVTR